MTTSVFHLWQFQVYKSGAEGFVVVLFWLDLWEILFLATPGFELGTSGSLVLHSTTVLWWLLVFTSDNFRHLTLVQRDLWWYCSDWTCERFSFWPHQGLNQGPLDLLSCTLILCHGDFWFSPLDYFRYLTVVQRDWCWYCSDWPYERFSFWPHQGLNMGTSGSLVLHSTTMTTVTSGIATLENFRYLTLVQRDWWWYCSDWTCERFSLWPHQGFELGTSGSLVLHSTTAPWQLLVFTSDNFRYLTLVQRDWWWYCSDWTCERFSFWPHQGLNWGPLDL